MSAIRLHRNGKRRGVALILTTLTLLVFGPMVGLAVDVGILYLLKAKLSQAVDAACLAGARSLARGQDLASQRANAMAVAERYFRINFPNGYWATTNIVYNISVTEPELRLRRVEMAATVDAPLYFLRLLGHDTARLRVTAAAQRRDVNVMMVLDISGSMQTAGACGALRSSATAFVDRFANGRDRLGMLTFNGATRLNYPMNLFFKDSPSIYTQINSLTCSGWTNTSQALWEGYQQLVALNEPGALNVILFFTDGRPTALTADYPIKTLPDVRYGDGNSGSSTSREDPFPPSPCQDEAGRTFPNPQWNPRPKRGFIAADNFNMTGITVGLYNQTTITSTSLIPSSQRQGCAMTTLNANAVRRDVAFIPDTDIYGNSTVNQSYKPGVFFPTGHPYAGKIRPDVPRALRHAAYNAADNAAWRIRSDTNLSPVIYVIGLGGTGGAETFDSELMTRIANDGDPRIQPDRPRGLYVYSPDSTQLTNAFLRIASEILRLAS
jgi:Flp pilus assembly protein TadG